MVLTVPSGSVQIVVLLHSFVFVLLVSDLPLVYSDVPKSIIGTIQSVVRSSVLIYLTVASGSKYRNHRRFDSFC